MKKFGHYEITAELGRGGMGVVYKGWEPSLNRKVAIKALGEHLLNDESLVERFTREAKATAALNDPNVIQIYFIGKEQGQPFFAMEYIEGQSLDDLLKGGRTLSVKHAKNILKQACQGLAAAHKINLVHRDIKPANMMLTNNGGLKVVDFGIALTREYGDKLTNTGEFVGTPGYLSPEVCIGKEVDQRSDIFALGIVFYEMLAGKVPFENDSPLGLMLEVVQSDIPDIRQLNKKVDKKTAFILQKMIAKSPDDRYQSCQEIIRDLGNVVDNQPLMAIKDAAQKLSPATIVKNPISDQITLPSAAAVTANNLTVQSAQPKNNKKWLAAAAVFALVGSAAFGYYQGYLPLPNNDNTTEQPSKVAALTNDGTMQAGLSKNDSINFTPESHEQNREENHRNKQENNQQNNQALHIVQNEHSQQPADNNATVDNATTDSIDVNKTLGNPKVAMHTNPQNALNGAANALNQGNSLDSSANEHNIREAQATGMDVAFNKKAATQPPSALDTTVAHQNIEQQDIGHQKLAVINGVKNKAQVMTSESEASMAGDVKQQIIKKAQKKTVQLNKGVVVVAFGDPAIANPVEKILEGELKQQGIKVMNEQFIPGMRQLLNDGLDLAALKMLIEQNGGQAMVIANVNYVGSQELNYAGRFTELINAQLDIDTYDIKTGDSIGDGFGAKLNYTALNATDQASDTVMQFTDQLASHLKNKI